jgi:hypothetical protein
MLLLINLLLLLLIGSLAFRLVSDAHLRASHLTSRKLEQRTVAATNAIPQPPMTLVPSEPDLAPVQQVLEWSQLDVATAQDAYADPIDGVPFAEGEQIHECECGVGYRAESVEWLAEHLSGRCVHCGATVEIRETVGA